MAHFGNFGTFWPILAHLDPNRFFGAFLTIFDPNRLVPTFWTYDRAPYLGKRAKREAFSEAVSLSLSISISLSPSLAENQNPFLGYVRAAPGPRLSAIG